MQMIRTEPPLPQFELEKPCCFLKKADGCRLHRDVTSLNENAQSQSQGFVQQDLAISY